MKLPKNVVKGIVILAFVIIICTFLSRLLNSSQTLAEYAAKNPEIAYKKSTETTEAESVNGTEESLESSKNTTASDEFTSVESDEYEQSSLRTTLDEGFYAEPIPNSVKERITGISYPEDAIVALTDLSYLHVKYYNFQDEITDGELICNASISADLLDIFHELYKAGYQIEKIKLIDEYQADDHLSMLDNNTSCFNYRFVDDTTKLSKHAYGLAIDINPYYNPYVTYENGNTKVSPEGSDPYADRTQDFAYKIDENDLCYKLFKAHGFTWGGDWNSCKDYQHFQKSN